MISALNKNTDELGIMSSALCIVHCAVTPFLLVSQASLAGLGLSATTWGAINFVFLFISFFAMMVTIRKSRLAWLKTAFVVSWVVLLVLVLNEFFELFHFHSIIDLTYFPALALIGLHIYHRRQCRCETACCD